MPIVTIQRRMMELGRIRLGDKGTKGQPQRLSSFRLTSASRALLEAAAVLYGGEVRDWAGAPDEGYLELYTEASELDVLLPPVLSMVDGHPTLPYSQYFELWSGGGCQRRCDGETELISGKPCLCDPDPEKRECRVTTRVSVMLPRVPGIGVWRLESHGWNAATELPGTLELLRLAAEGNRFIPAVLRIEHRTQKKGGQSRKFIVPVIDLPGTTAHELVSGGPLVLNPPAGPALRPELPSGDSELPGDPSFATDTPAENPSFGDAPELPELGEGHLRDQLLATGERLGKSAETESAIEAAEQRYANEPAKLLAWLGRQLKSAEAKLASQATA